MLATKTYFFSRQIYAVTKNCLNLHLENNDDRIQLHESYLSSDIQEDYTLFLMVVLPPVYGLLKAQNVQA